VAIAPSREIRPFHRACAIGSAVAFLVIEPVTVRAAFGDGPARDSAE